MNIVPFFEKFFRNIRKIFHQGLTPSQLSLTVAMIIILGIFPFFYLPTILVIATCARLKLNLTIMMVENYLVYPLQIILFIPFVQVGTWVTHSAVNVNEIQFFNECPLFIIQHRVNLFA